MAAGIGAIEEKPYRFLLIVAALSEKQNRKSITKKGVIATPKKAPAPVKTTSTSGKTKNTQKVTAKRKVLSKVTPLNNSVAEPDMAPTTKAAKPLSKPAKKTTAVKKALKKAKTQSKGAVSAQKSKNIKPSKTNTQTKPKVKVKTEMSPIVFAKEDKGIEQEAPLKKISEGKAIKFSWKTDADGKFVMVSNEILDTLGVDATLVLNKSWDEVARNFNLDQSEKIVELFNTKDTWSGQQVLWPISGSTDKDGMADNKLVPVDFAALPSVDRNKNFNGYNGFGIIHMNLIKTVTEPAPIKVEPAPKKSNAKPVEALNGEEKAAFDEIARTLGQSSDDEKIDTPEIAKPPLAKSTPAKPKPEPISNEATAIVPTPPIKKAQPLIEVTPPIETKPAIVPTPEKPEVAAKKTSHQDISGVLDQIPVPLMVYRDNSLLFASSDFLKLTHYKNIEEINEAGALDALFDNSADEGDKSDADQMQLILKNGETCNVNARLQRIDWSDGNALLMAFTSIEQQTQNMAITEPQANTEEKISTEHDKAIGMTLEDESQFMTRVSHEIRAPLNTIIGFSDLIMDERFGPLRNDKYREYMRDIRRSGSLMLDIINDYLDLSKIKSGDIILKEEMININQLIKDTVAIVQPQANGDQIIIRTSLSKAVPSVKTDSNTVRQVVLNLISSAIKATPTGGQIIISSLLDSSGEVIVRIKDSGDGIDEEMLEYVLEPSKSLVKSKVDPSQMDKHHSGLELSLTKAMVEATGAKFEIFSELKKGTVVELAFPKT
jgi:signal transduction histidine kinase